MEHFGLIGHPLGHSVSPIIHKRLFDFSKRSGCDYRLFDISPESLPAQIGTLASLRGYNVTIPHKQAIIPYLDQLDSAAERYRAVNVVQNQNGILSGYNTDVTGFLKSVEQLGVSFSGKRILVLGYGGAGRMMATEAAFQGAAEISIAARRASLEKAEKLAVEIRKAVLGCKVTSLPLENVSREYDLIVNSTPSGMYPNINESPLTKKQLIGSKALFDAIYNPSETRLMADAKGCGLAVAGGMTMLVWQAAAAHTIWYGAQFDTKEIEQLIYEMECYVLSHFQQ